MKSDIINKLIAFFKTNDVKLLGNPTQLKMKLIDAYGPEYELEISLFCKICDLYRTKELNNPDISTIIAHAKNLNEEHKINEKVAVVFLGCYAYTKRLITIDTLKELSLYKSTENENLHVYHQNTNTEINDGSFMTSTEQKNKYSETEPVFKKSKKKKGIIKKLRKSIGKRKNLLLLMLGAIGFISITFAIILLTTIVNIPLIKKDNANIKIITITENDQDYDIEAVSGQVIVMFEQTVSHLQAVRYIKSLNGKIINQIKEIRYYLVDVGIGNESSFINRIKHHAVVDFVFLNTIEYPCEVKPIAMDNFYTPHGSKVTYAFQQCGLETNVNISNVGIKNDEKGRISLDAVNTELSSILRKTPQNEPLVINMSFGPGLIKDDKKYYWTDEDITDLKDNYKKQYKQGLIDLVKTVSAYNDKDFVIIKAAGNEGLKELDTEILNELRRDLKLTEMQKNILDKHFILVGAKDTRNKKYSNAVSLGAYDSLFTSVDISDLALFALNDYNLYGTSYAAPRLSCFISFIINNFGITATETLMAIKDITRRNPEQPITEESLYEEASRIAKEKESKSEDNNMAGDNKSNEKINGASFFGDLSRRSRNLSTIENESVNEIIYYDGSFGIITDNKINFYSYRSDEDGYMRNDFDESMILPNEYKYVFTVENFLRSPELFYGKYSYRYLIGVIVNNKIQFFYRKDEHIPDVDMTLPNGYKNVFGFGPNIGVVVNNKVQFYAYNHSSGWGYVGDSGLYYDLELSGIEFELPRGYKDVFGIGRTGYNGIVVVVNNKLQFYYYYINYSWDVYHVLDFPLPTGYKFVTVTSGSLHDYIMIIVDNKIQTYRFFRSSDSWEIISSTDIIY
jgi:hypothetical protein